MSYTWDTLIDRVARRSKRRSTAGTTADPAVTIRLARDADRPRLEELAVLDSARPLTGPALVAVVDDRLWAAHGLADDRVIADPFQPSAEAAGLLALRARQLRAAQRRSESRTLRQRRLARDGDLRNS